MRGSYINFAKKFQTNRQSPSSASPSGKLSAQRTEEDNYVLFSASPWGAFLAELLPKGNYGGLLSTKLTDEGVVTLTLLKNFKQTDSRPPWLPLGGSCPQSGLKRSIISALYQASPRGAFLAELPPKGNYGGLLCHVVAVMKGGYIIDS